MKKHVFVLLVVSLLMLAVAVSIVSAAGRPVHQVSGDGKLMKPDGTFDTFAFVVQIDGEDVVTGQGGIQAHGYHYFNHWEANCLTVEGNTAWIGAVLTHESPPISPAGSEFTLQIQVNDQGAWVSYAAAGDEFVPCYDKPDLFNRPEGYHDWQIGKFKIR